MALGQTDITTTLIRNTIAAAVNSVSELCVHANINKWSKYKPVRGSFPSGTGGTYGIDLTNNWAYLKPRGAAYSEPYRMGDFRGYNHVALPTFKLSLYPNVTQSNVNDLNFTLEVNENDITVENLLLSGYYFGIKLTDYVNNITYHAATFSLLDRATEAGALSIHISNLPEGSYTWQAYISPDGLGTGLIYLPAFGSYVISGVTEISLDEPIATFNNTVSGVTVGGPYVRDEDHIHFTALNTGSSVEVSFTASLNGGAPVACGTAVINEGDPDTGLPVTTGIIAGVPQAGYGDALLITVS